MRTFVVVSGAICGAFLLVLLYLAQATAVSTLGYEAQRLESVRNELHRTNALLELENARLDSPSRIEVEASKLGLVRATRVAVVPLEPLAANR